MASGSAPARSSPASTQGVLDLLAKEGASSIRNKSSELRETSATSLPGKQIGYLVAAWRKGKDEPGSFAQM